MLPKDITKVIGQERPQDMERYRIVAPIRFRWKTDSGSWREGSGITRDVSQGGVFVLCHPVPVPGSAIEVTVELPPLGGLKAPLVLHGKGTVVRVEPNGAGPPIGFSAAVVLEDDEAALPGGSQGWNK